MLTRTENGALAFGSTRNEVLDLFFTLADTNRKFDADDLRDKVLSSARVNPQDTLKVLVHSRDCRGGKGIRSQSLFGMVTFLCFCDVQKKGHVIDLLLRVLPHFGRYRDVIDLYRMASSHKTAEKLPLDDKTLCKPLRHAVVDAYWAALSKDLIASTSEQGEPGDKGTEEDKTSKPPSISLAAKWITSEKKPRLASFYRMLARKAFPDCANSCERLRKEVLKPLRRRLDVVESRITDRDYASIDYSKVPSKAMSKYAQVFSRNDEERHGQFLERIREGKTNVKGGRLYPHEIVRQLRKLLDLKYAEFYAVDDDSSDDEATDIQTTDIDAVGSDAVGSDAVGSDAVGSDAVGSDAAAIEQLEHQWDSMVKDNVNAGSLGKTIVLSDVSGSMEGTPMDVSVALGILISDFSEEPFRGKVITFSSEPQFHELPRKARLRSKMKSMFNMNWGQNTDLMAVFRLILDRLMEARKKGEPCQAPETLVILSDMQFDIAIFSGAGNNHMTTFETARDLFRKQGFELPSVVFWNLRNTSSSSFPVKEHETGTCLVSGPSPTLLNSLMLGKELSPARILKDAVLDNARYDIVTYPGPY